MTANRAAAPRNILVVAHTGRPENVAATRHVVGSLRAAGLVPWLLADEHHDVGEEIPAMLVEPGELPPHTSLVVVLGGDGTILRAAELARPLRIPLLGVNLGRVGFLAEREREAIPDVIAHIIAEDYQIEERLVIDVSVRCPDGTTHLSWAVNEASLEKAARGRTIEVVTEVDGRPVSSFGGDGVVLATPTGSTAYAFSAGGPVVWPNVEALLMVPISAHALFAKPLVTGPDSTLAVEVRAPEGGGILWCDGRRPFDVPQGARVEVRRSCQPLLLARLVDGPFTDRLVEKFRLPVSGWRGPSGE